ncbi:MAG: hypothetical protein EXS15_05565 [Phycisphaerales bacterium]|nr:hypothetical protein [Phycisphaerales bacterium]
MSPTLATSPHAAQPVAGVIPEDETILLMVKPSSWFIVVTSMRALPAAAAAGAILMVASLDPSIPWDFRGAILASTAIIVARAAWQSLDWCVRLYVLTDRRIVVRRGVIPEVSECLLAEVAGIGQPRRRIERLGRTGSLAILRGPSIRVRRARRAKQKSLDEESAQLASSESRRIHPRVHVEHSLEWSVIRDGESVRRKILAAVARYR